MESQQRERDQKPQPKAVSLSLAKPANKIRYFYFDILARVGYTGIGSDGFSPDISICGCYWRRKGSSAIDGCKAGWISLFSAVYFFRLPLESTASCKKKLSLLVCFTAYSGWFPRVSESTISISYLPLMYFDFDNWFGVGYTEYGRVCSICVSDVNFRALVFQSIGGLLRLCYF